MNSAIKMMLAGPAIDKTGEPYRIYQAGLLLSAQIKAAIWLLRDQPDTLIRTQLRAARKDLSRRSDARAKAFGPHCSRMEPTIANAVLDGLRDRHADPKNQAYALVRGAIDGLDVADQETQNDACVVILSEHTEP